MVKSFKIFVIDAFTAVPFKGNPAAVCIVPKNQELPDCTMQHIASEMNLSETAFVQETDEPVESGDSFGLRWLTPTNEVDLCGHATLASAAALFYGCGNPSSKLHFHTRSGVLLAERVGDNIGLTLPLADISKIQDEKPLATLLKVLHIMPCDIYIGSAPVGDLLIRLPDSWSREELEAMPVPNPAELMASVSKDSGIRGVIVTLKGSASNEYDAGSGRFDFVSRYFAPWNGIPEDPVTGSAHTVLGNYWSDVLGKTDLYARQCSPRGGNLRLKVDKEENNIFVGGPAAVVLRGQIEL